MTQNELQSHYGPEGLKIGLTQPTPEELRLIEEGHRTVDTTLPGSTQRSVGFQALRAEWGPAHHSDDYERIEIPTPEDLNYSA